MVDHILEFFHINCFYWDITKFCEIFTWFSCLLGHSVMYNKIIQTKYWFKGTVRVISSYPVCDDDNTQFMTVAIKALSDYKV